MNAGVDVVRVVFELCAETLEACRAAGEGGADRIELCEDLDSGGLTPPVALTRAAAGVRVPVHVMIRPRAGDFVYGAEEVEAMLAQVEKQRAAGAKGFVFGCLQADGKVDEAALARLMEAVRGEEVTFHRAFDETQDLEEALEVLIRHGIGRVLTSGGAVDVEQGALILKGLVEQARGRIAVAMGGGVTLENAGELLEKTGVPHIHASLRAEREELTMVERVRMMRATVEKRLVFSH